MSDFRTGILCATFSGLLMAPMSALTHALNVQGALKHEVYMPAFATCLTACIVPLLLIHDVTTSVNEEKRNRVKAQMRLLSLTFIVLITAVQTLLLERLIMKRWVEDYDPKMHSLPGLTPSDVHKYY